MKVILVDDHVLFAKSLEIVMKNKVTHFLTYESPENILSIIDQEKPDILLLDIHMGKYSGLEVGKEILTNYPKIAIIFLSGYDLVEYHKQAISIGAKGFINKNTSIDDLLQKIERVARGETIFPIMEETNESLTNREKEVLQLAANGLKQQEIADTLCISRRTVNNHMQTINDKLAVNSTVSAIVKGIELGVIKVKI